MKKAEEKRFGAIGSSIDSFLRQDGIYEEVTVRAIKRVLARQLDAEMSEKPVETD
jgi:antitoxin HicB